jgi:4-alpha-glucanotransferase
MPSDNFEQLLDRAAAQYGIEPGFWDIWGRYHTTSDETRKAILKDIGIEACDTGSLQQSLADVTRRDWERLTPPSVVTAEAPEAQIAISVPVEALGQSAHVVVRREDGQSEEFDFGLSDLPHAGSIEMNGRTWVRKRIRVPVALPLGYHDIFVTVGSLRGITRYIVTPERAWSAPHLARGGRAAGIAISLYGLRSDRNWGCGDFTDLLEIIDWAASAMGASFVALNPLHAIHNRRPFNTSPYLPNCIFYQNFIYLDVEAMEDFAHSRRAQCVRQTPAVAAEIEELRRTPVVEYERVGALKLRFLKLAFLEFLREWRNRTPRALEFQKFITDEGDLLERFALYCALDEVLHRRDLDLWIWPQWPEPYRDPSSPETRAFRQSRWRRVMFYQYIQWQIDVQLRRAQQRARERGLSIGLYHDLALATDRFGSDLWAHRRFYIPGCRVGSPPDDFSPSGQDWGFPPPNSERHRENGYRLFAESIRKNCRRGGALRIDHVMRLFRLYWIPEGKDASAGAYVRERSDDFVRILALESVRNQVVVVGEDLGTVEPAIRETLDRFGILSYRLFYFEKHQNGAFRRFDEYPMRALVSSTTHDLPTLAGFWLGSDLEARRSAGVLDERGFREQWGNRQREKQKMLDLLFATDLMPRQLPREATAYPELIGELHNAIVGFLASTPSQLMAINEEDLTKETAQQNLPGTTWQYPNWSRKMRFTIEELKSNPEACAYTEMFRNWINHCGRRNQP